MGYKDFEYVDLDNRRAVLTYYIGRNKNVIVPDEINGLKVVSLGDNFCFRNCEIEFVEIPDSVKLIGHNCFSLCSNLRRVRLGNMIEKITESCFFGSGIEEIELPDSVIVVGSDHHAGYSMNGCFGSCGNLKRVVLNEGITILGKSCFREKCFGEFQWFDSIDKARGNA